MKNVMLRRHDRGISMIGWIIIGAIALVALGFYGIDVQNVVENPTSQKNISYVRGGVEFVWKNYLSKPVDYLWNDVFVDLIWGAFTENMGRIKGGRATQLEEMAPKFDFGSL